MFVSCILDIIEEYFSVFIGISVKVLCKSEKCVV